ncbi:MAG: YdbL family protein [Sphingomonadaceae bacterium]|nr:YdbL family protein [Sphingomonadaceae bacterium]
MMRILVAGAALALVWGVALAQSGPIAAAISAGQVGEQADGYLGVAKPVSADVKAQVEAINIKRRAAYTDQASAHGVALSDWAATIGCQTLRRVSAGETYRLLDGVWRTKGAEPIALPSVCG